MDCPSVCIEVLVFNFGSVLLIKNDMQNPEAKWRFPRTAQCKGETIQQAAERAVLEQCGVTIQAVNVVNAYDQITECVGVGEKQHQVVIDIESNYSGGDFTCDNESTMAAWASGMALKTMDIDKTTLAILNDLGFIDWS